MLIIANKIKYVVGLYRDWHLFAIDQEECDDRVVFSDLDEQNLLVKSGLCYVLCGFVTEIVKKMRVIVEDPDMINHVGTVKCQ